MKALFLMITLLASSFAFSADRVIELGSKKVIVGQLAQDRGAAAQATLEVVRTTATPDLVELVFNFKQGDYVCTEYRTRTVFEPGYYRVVCSTDRQGRQYCRRIYTGGYYRTYQECVRNEYRLFDDARVLKLNFKKAAQLNAGERETFTIDFSQRGIDSSRFNYSATSRDAAASYDIKFSTFLRKDTFFFKAK
ncbi:MAG: hypothetical protein COW01_07645 [Bdellovibrionales bacterium CG12_big_fil_rev_8_21_14_0_65_38_15]|nr:MAG: hypothetical protein COW79_11145 [Bdellovibrionales bacterium CG22_combo_CG10-13_8_21_14_all_38_13]PIQ55243.1 MAG: hypothetical protein COW01_07645 [Bdellovibrionales bacterium CG12_big_fil_rev_8_21_14_0_65_38_15]PIR30509.1 MAG: hypothetical protein COV38_05005 [Bdellovibrionales bacterium CG11_big_fil_rev_8_21_14_0_20_38_13]